LSLKQGELNAIVSVYMNIDKYIKTNMYTHIYLNIHTYSYIVSRTREAGVGIVT
jgi:hypothetical protein